MLKIRQILLARGWRAGFAGGRVRGEAGHKDSCGTHPCHPRAWPAIDALRGMRRLAKSQPHQLGASHLPHFKEIPQRNLMLNPLYSGSIHFTASGTTNSKRWEDAELASHQSGGSPARKFAPPRRPMPAIQSMNHPSLPQIYQLIPYSRLLSKESWGSEAECGANPYLPDEFPPHTRTRKMRACRRSA